ncbi:MAG TPA: wax ester/triacylglycerol synthase family O-acyltransferase [Kofleriaceae bacterium]|nr:wax ester/triacylglycerol synthase family O-acyltransferase [Kofleriaceae bacterium]
MPREHFERLTALDASFLALETETAHMHVGAVITLEANGLENSDGGIDIDKIRTYIDSQLHRAPRYRQKLRWVPGLRHPVWIDDDQFNIHYHVRHTALPRQGDERQLKRMAGRLFSQRLDRSRPLWEIWVVELLEGDRFALIIKAHHCMVDGVAGAELFTLLLRGTPDASIPDARPWEPRPAPSGGELLAAELTHRATGTRSLLAELRDNLTEHAQSLWDETKRVAGMLKESLTPASPTPLNPKAIGPHRRFDVTRFELADVKAVKNALGGTINDVVLAVTVGALARFFERRGIMASTLPDFRAMIPVSVRKRADGGTTGNRIAMMLAKLPIDEPDPVARFVKIHEVCEYLKHESGQADGAAKLEEVTDATVGALLSDVIKLAARQRPFNVVVTNVPGPPVPLYLLGARITEVYPLVPLYENQALGVALISYAGGLYWGLVADWQSIPDMHDLIGDLEAAFAELRTLADAATESHAASP